MQPIVFWTFWATLVIVGHLYVGYAVIAKLAALRRGRPAEVRELPAVSLIVTAHDEEDVLALKLENALALEYPPGKLEILLASDGSTDRTTEIARNFSQRGVRLLDFHHRRGKAAVLNDAVAAATGDVICLCDANVMFRPDALTRLVERLADPNVGAVTGDVRLASHQSDFGPGESLYYRFERMVQLGESRIGSLMGVDGGMYVIRKELYQPLPPDTILDDFVISMQVIRRGKRVVYEPAAIAHENGTPTWRQEFRRRVRVAAGAAQSIKRRQWPPLRSPIELWQYASHKLLRWLGPVWLAMLLVSSALLWNAGAFYRAAALAQAAVYATAALAWLWPSFRRTRLGAVPFYFAMSHAAMAVGLVKGLFNLQKVTWTKANRGKVDARPASIAQERSVAVID